MQINRLFEIIYILLDKNNVTADELAERFEVSRRTIYRDIELLSQSGIPIYTTRGKKGGIGILDNFVLNKALISDKEQSAIIAALGAMASLPNIEKTGIEGKLSSLFKKSDTSWISVDFSGWNIEQKGLFDEMKTAVIENRIVDMEYINSRGETSKRTVEPMKLWFKGRAWYLIAYCQKAGDYRIFRLSRIRNTLVTDIHFDRDMSGFEYNSDNDEKWTPKNTEITLKISHEAEYRVYDEFIDFQKTKDGDFIVKINFIEDEWLYGYIMSFGNHAQVLEPIRVRELIKEKIKKTLKNYL